MGFGFTSDDDEFEEEYIPLYRTIIECPICKDDLANYDKGFCSCKNLEIDEVETISKVRHVAKSNWTHFKTVSYAKEPPNIYEVLLADELP
tara:strand:- start:575 stop:847 length:273 start_codon:yes stop_codon:yes gene_type:complete